MMTYTEYLLVCLAEECAEVGQRATKALRFGLREKQPGQSENNARRLLGEIDDVNLIVELLGYAGVFLFEGEKEAKRNAMFLRSDLNALAKRYKVFRYMDHAMEQGTFIQEGFRASGDVICALCGEVYRKHPLGGLKGMEDRQFLHRLCDGSLVKL